MRNTIQSYQVIVMHSLIFSFLILLTTQHSFSPIQSIHDNETLASAAGNFEAGFFSFENSLRRYFGIWYKNITPRTFVWVANRDSPLRNSGDFILTDSGNLVILDDLGVIVWSSNSSRIAENPVMQLLDTGNLVVSDGNNKESILWESFNYPGDTFLPGMKLQSNLVTGPYRYLTSWRSTEDPAPGEFSYHIDTHGYPQLVITKGENISFRGGSWNGHMFTGAPWQKMHKILNMSFVFADKEVSYECEALNSSTVTRTVLNPSGVSQRLVWSDRTQNWEILAGGPMDQCEYYAFCGANSNCNINNSPLCECLKGFIPKFEANSNSNDWSGGCVRRMNLNCDSGDGFLRYTGMTLPDTSSSWFDKIMSLEDCETVCLKNCSCTAYANLDIRDGGSGCLLWFGDIMDMRKHTSDGQDIYIRLAASELDHIKSNRNSYKKKLAGIVVGLTMLIISITILGLAIRIRKKKLMKPGIIKPANGKDKRKKEEIDLPTFDLSTISNATNNFSISNKLGEGGFGPVYRGLLANGQEIAVKRLSKSSRQGSEEFKNELVLIANLQHRNLVRLLGCCILGDERLLIYEFMPNRSLDYFIFDHTRSNLLNWIKRIQIINGIARGLLYLHQDSRLKIIHRDIKTSNILLDDNMDPKISDFGLARAFEEDQIEVDTERVMGTYGYMPPEYASHGSFSVKSDVFGFGVIILEIVSGRKNREIFDPHYNLNLIGYAWRLWSGERLLELIDKSLGHSSALDEVLRCIQVGLLCVQERPKDRPDMLSVVLMLNGEKPLPKPMKPAFYPHQIDPFTGKLSSSISVTILDPR